MPVAPFQTLQQKFPPALFVLLLLVSAPSSLAQTPKLEGSLWTAPLPEFQEFMRRQGVTVISGPADSTYYERFWQNLGGDGYFIDLDTMADDSFEGRLAANLYYGTFPPQRVGRGLPPFVPPPPPSGQMIVFNGDSANSAYVRLHEAGHFEQWLNGTSSAGMDEEVRLMSSHLGNTRHGARVQYYLEHASASSKVDVRKYLAECQSALCEQAKLKGLALNSKARAPIPRELPPITSVARFGADLAASAVISAIESRTSQTYTQGRINQLNSTLQSQRFLAKLDAVRATRIRREIDAIQGFTGNTVTNLQWVLTGFGMGGDPVEEWRGHAYDGLNRDLCAEFELEAPDIYPPGYNY